MRPDTLAVIRDLLEHEGYDWRELVAVLRENTEDYESNTCAKCGDYAPHHGADCAVAKWLRVFGSVEEVQRQATIAEEAARWEAEDREQQEAERWCPQRRPPMIGFQSYRVLTPDGSREATREEIRRYLENAVTPHGRITQIETMAEFGLIDPVETAKLLP